MKFSWREESLKFIPKYEKIRAVTGTIKSTVWTENRDQVTLAKEPANMR